MTDGKVKPGPTGRFPEGKLVEHDEGQMVFEIGTVNGAVAIKFARPVLWIGLGPAEARDLAKLLMEHAASLEN